MKTIEVIVAKDGSITIDAIGFTGTDCEKATAFLEQALGRRAKRVDKAERHRFIRPRQQIGA